MRNDAEQHGHLLLLLDSTEHFVLRKKHGTEKLIFNFSN
jgi:hypothetical protein